MDNEIVATAFHEYRFLTVDGMVFVAFHPIRDVLQVPSTCCLFSSIDTSNELQAITVWNGLRPPIWGTNVNDVVANVAVKKGLLGVGLEDRAAMFGGDNNQDACFAESVALRTGDLSP